MDIPKRGLVICQGKECGHVNSIIINPLTFETSHLVVEEDVMPNQERIVPIELVEKTTAHFIYLSCTKQEFLHLDNFKEHQYFPVEKAYGMFPIKHLAYIPYNSSIKTDVADITFKRIPKKEINFPFEDLEVRAVDGKIGKINDLIIDKNTEKLTHIIASTGHLWAKKILAIPVSKIKNIEKNIVNLKIRKNQANKYTGASKLMRFDM